jgi:tRNA threonylcarbamoyladenosine biosynthesis protein TsaB
LLYAGLIVTQKSIIKMSLILNIDTATEQASVSLAQEGKILAASINRQQKDHAAWIHTAIDALFEESGHRPVDLKAIAVVAGPGSYTGLRVAMATAKGFCYVNNVPLITLNTLVVMAYAASKEFTSNSVLLCPMIDARRMEVFTALYHKDLKEIAAPCAMILEQGSFDEWFLNNTIVFFGSGAAKWQKLVKNNNAFFSKSCYQPLEIAYLSFQRFKQGDFSDLAYSVPFYVKDFYTHHKK